MKKIIKLVLPFLVGGVIGGLGAGFVLKEDIDLSHIRPGLALVTFLLAFWSQVILHELGHLLMGKLAGFRFYSFRVGYLALEMENGRIRYKTYKNLGYLGLCLMIPTRGETSRRAMMLFMAGGLLLNLFSLLVCTFLILTRDLGAGWGPYFIYGSAIAAFLFFVSNALPLKTKGNLATDGRYLLDGLRQNSDYRFLSHLFALHARAMGGLQPADIPVALLPDPELVPNPMLKVNFLVFRYYHHLDKGEPGAAADTLAETEKYLDDYPATQRAEVEKEILFACSYLRPDREKAEALHRKIEARLRMDQSLGGNRIKAAYELGVRQNRDQARTYLEQGKKVAGTDLVKGFIPLELRLIAQLEALADAPDPVPPVEKATEMASPEAG